MSTAIAPGATIGILGGGQLGRMTALAAARLGYRCHVFAPEEDSPAFQVAAAHTLAAYEDEAALGAFARAVEVVTFEFENVPSQSLERLAARLPVRPKPEILHVTQDRLREKDFLRGIGVATTDYRRADNVAELAEALSAIGRPSVLKTRRFGYDGKGQVAIGTEMEPDQAWRAMAPGQAMAAPEGILEAFVDFELEISVIVARGIDGATACYDPVENRHRNHILHATLAPARLAPPLLQSASAIARRIAEALGLVGLLAVEMFVTRDGRILVNELAPRPHNSGHWSIDACATSQFEQLVRAVCALPLGSTLRHSDAAMTNLLGDEVERWPALLAEPGARLHLYGKREIRPGRKMGHVTRLYPLGGLPTGL
jgi:5-(carboxyamino)imidazole ribonucleotide synthase